MKGVKCKGFVMKRLWIVVGQGTFDVKLYPLEEFMFVLHEMSPKKQGQFTTHRLKSSNSPYRLMDELACVWHQKVLTLTKSSELDN
jgi:hypothetical protein